MAGRSGWRVGLSANLPASSDEKSRRSSTSCTSVWPALAHAGQIVRLFGGKPCLVEEVAHAENAGERRADLVADGGEQLRLVAAFGLRPLDRPGEEVDIAGVRRDRPSDAQAAETVGGRIADEGLVEVKPRAVRHAELIALTRQIQSLETLLERVRTDQGQESLVGGQDPACAIVRMAMSPSRS